MVVLLAVSVAGASCASDESQQTPPVISVDSEWSRAAVAIPAGAQVIEPGESLQDAVDSAQDDAVFVLAGGVHRLQQVDPRPNQTFVGEPGAVMSGAVILESFQALDRVWVHHDIYVDGEERGRCRREAPACRLPEDLFVDDQLMTRVLAEEEVDDMSWYLDSASGRLVMGADPTDSVVELSVLPYAFGGDAPNVTIEGLVIEKYASPGQRGAIAAGRSWTISASEIRHNHGTGVKAATGMLLEDSFLHHNGQFGISGGGVDVVIRGSEISHNGVVGYNPLWAAGGTKFVQVTNLVVTDNFVHSNLGPGLWTDAGRDNTLYEGNRVIGNEHAGIKHEISGSALIRRNDVSANGFGHAVKLRGPGILIRESGPVEVVGNRIFGNVDAIVLLQDDNRTDVGDYRLDGIRVSDNDISLDGGKVGVVGDLDRDILGVGIVFEGNRYYGSEDDAGFVVLGRTVDSRGWREATSEDSPRVVASEFPFP